MSDWLEVNAERVHESAVKIRQIASGLQEATITDCGEPSQLGPNMRAYGEISQPLLGRGADAVAGTQNAFGEALLAAVEEYVSLDVQTGTTFEMVPE